MATWLRAALTILTAVAALAASGAAAVAPLAVLQPVGTFAQPIDVAAPQHEDHLLFVAELAGRIRVVRDGTLLARPFLDISALVSAVGEGGLLSIAFPHRYWQTGRFVVCYVDLGGSIRVAEYRRSASDPEVADPLSARTVLSIPHPTYVNHYGGSMEFGPDGLLYIGTGDGGGGGDPDGNAQRFDVLLGKPPRVNPFSGDPYAIPAGNPFVGVAGARPEIFAYGLRNPWRFSFDSATGDLVIGDVGQNLVEEVDAVAAPVPGGLNFGWNVFEGSLPYAGGTAPGAVAPVLEYPHRGGACSITGGVVVRDALLPALAGRYVYGDWCVGDVRSAVLGWPAATGDADTGLDVPQVVAFGEDAGRCVYAVSLAGGVYRLAATAAAAPVPCADVPPDTSITSAPPTPTAVSFAFTATEAGSSFECRLDVGPWGACASPAGYTLAGGTHVFEVRASDPGGTVDPTPATASLIVPGPTGGGGGVVLPPAVVTPPPPPPPVPATTSSTPLTPPTSRTSTRGVTRTGTARANALVGTARNDTLHGRAGDDVLRGVGGDDVLVGGAGRDRLLGGAGDDHLQARDSQRDVIDCGPGRDTATADRKDVVRGCEHVTRSGP